MPKENDKNAQRPPVVVVMGHIDHGKSKLLDYVRNTNVVEGEAGGITQHIGAYEAEVKCNSSEHGHHTKKITFLDTPGHEAFSKMRMRGADAADIAILVISAEEGVKPQTMEAYHSIQKAGIPFVVAMNKIDKPEANVEKVKMQLAENSILVEGYGGDIPYAAISAKTGQGVEELLDLVLLMAEMRELKGNVEEMASGFIIESNMDPQRGISATLLIRNGSLSKGQFVAAGKAMAPVRIFEDFRGKQIEAASFSSPVRITGFSELPGPGSQFKSFKTKSEAEEYAAAQKEESGENKITSAKDIGEGKVLVSVVIKADVGGSIEAIEKEIRKLESDDVIINVLRTGTGNISEEDVKMASGGENSIIFGFNVSPDASAKELAERFGVNIFTSDIIYKLSEWLEEEINKRKAAAVTERIIGRAQILKPFSQAKNKQLVGGKVIEGKISIGRYLYRIKRDEAEIGTLAIDELQQSKVKVKEVEEGKEFGMMAESKTEIKAGDIVEIVEKLS